MSVIIKLAVSRSSRTGFSGKCWVQHMFNKSTDVERNIKFTIRPICNDGRVFKQ